MSTKTFNDTKDDLQYQQQRLAILKQSIQQTESLQSSQLHQLRVASTSLNSRMGIARSNLGQLSIRAPVTGELSGFDIQLGQSLQQGERIGQIDSSGGNKLQADVDEFYLGRVHVGQTATADLDGKTYRLKVAKVYPQVRNGQFEIDLLFDGAAPTSVQRGQTLQTKLTLGDSSKAAADPERRFLQRHRRQLDLRRRQERQAARPSAKSSSAASNGDFIEVLGGL